MDWLLANWFWALVFAVFFGMHLFGHVYKRQALEK